LHNLNNHHAGDHDRKRSCAQAGRQIASSPAIGSAFLIKAERRRRRTPIALRKGLVYGDLCHRKCCFAGFCRRDEEAFKKYQDALKVQHDEMGLNTVSA